MNSLPEAARGTPAVPEAIHTGSLLDDKRDIQMTPSAAAPSTTLVDVSSVSFAQNPTAPPPANVYPTAKRLPWGHEVRDAAALSTTNSSLGEASWLCDLEYYFSWEETGDWYEDVGGNLKTW